MQPVSRDALALAGRVPASATGSEHRAPPTVARDYKKNFRAPTMTHCRLQLFAATSVNLILTHSAFHRPKNLHILYFACEGIRDRSICKSLIYSHLRHANAHTRAAGRKSRSRHELT